MAFWKKAIDQQKADEAKESKMYKAGRGIRQLFIYLIVAALLGFMGYG